MGTAATIYIGLQVTILFQNGSWESWGSISSLFFFPLTFFLPRHGMERQGWAGVYPTMEVVYALLDRALFCEPWEFEEPVSSGPCHSTATNMGLVLSHFFLRLHIGVKDIPLS